MPNDIKLGESQPLDENLRPIKVDDESTPIEIAKEETKIDSDLEVTGEIKGSRMGANIPMIFGSGSAETSFYLKVYAKQMTWHDHATGETGLTMVEGWNRVQIHEQGDPDDYFFWDMHNGVDNGAIILGTVDASGANAHMTLDPDGDLIVSGADVKIDEGQKLYLDGGGDTYVVGNADSIDIVVGGVMLVRSTEGADGQRDWKFRDSAVGFDQDTASYHAVNTSIDFRAGNKVMVTFGTGNITNLNCYFPNMSGNFLVLIKQDASGSRTITNYRHLIVQEIQQEVVVQLNLQEALHQL